MQRPSSSHAQGGASGRQRCSCIGCCEWLLCVAAICAWLLCVADTVHFRDAALPRSAAVPLGVLACTLGSYRLHEPVLSSLLLLLLLCEAVRASVPPVEQSNGAALGRTGAVPPVCSMLGSTF